MTLANNTRNAHRITEAVLDNDGIADQSHWLQVHEQLVKPNDVMHNIVSEALQSAYNAGLSNQDYDELQQHVAQHIADYIGQKLAETLLPYVHEAINSLDDGD